MTAFRRGLAAACLLTFAAAPALAQDPSFRLNNRSGTTINEVYVSSSNDSNWGPDRLGSDVLRHGFTLTIRLPRGQCLNDVKVVFAGGRELERRRVDTCQLTDLNVD